MLGSLIEGFDRQFEPYDEGFLYRYAQTREGFFVSAAQRDAWIADYRKAIGRASIELVLWIAIPVFFMPEGFGLLGCVIAMVRAAMIILKAHRAPLLAQAGRPPVEPALSNEAASANYWADRPHVIRRWVPYLLIFPALSVLSGAVAFTGMVRMGAIVLGALILGIAYIAWRKQDWRSDDL
ncbi:MAG TPA: hypothetical protein VHG29_08460 [Novosphingobium sp.]|nr:hypothetical protein [Novosphingobium sp.]